MKSWDETGWQELERSVRTRDGVLMRCYLGGLLLAGACFYLPSRLSQVGAGLLVIAFLHMMARLYRAHHPGRRLPAELLWMHGVHPRLALVESILFYIPFLVGANILFMGIPLGIDRLQKSIWDCWFLGMTVVLLVASYCWNRRVARRLLAGAVFLRGGQGDSTYPV